MAGTARAAGGLYGVLDALRTGSPVPADVQLNPAQLVGKSQAEIADILVQAIRPPDGTQDSDAARDSMGRAFSELLEANPNTDLATLTTPQIEQILESYVSNDLAQRVDLDVGKAVLDKAPNYSDGVDRLEEMKAFVKEQVALAFRNSKAAGQTINRSNAASIVNTVLRETFDIFESYL